MASSGYLIFYCWLIWAGLHAVHKGVEQLKKLMPALKRLALQDDANVNVDETWMRYLAHARVKFKYALEQGCEKAG